MEARLAPLVIPLYLATLAALVMAAYAWRRRAVPGAMPLALLMASLSWWMFTYAAELTVGTFSGKFFFARFRYFGIYGAVLSWVVVALTFCGRDRWLTRNRAIAVATIPVLTILVVLTNGTHGPFWSEIALRGGPTLTSEHGRWFWVHFTFVYGTLLVTTVLVLVESLRSHAARALAVPLMLAVILPWAANAAHLSGCSPWAPVDPTPFALAVSGLGFAFALFRQGFLDIVPVAAATVVASMPDAMLVLDRRQRLVDLNPAAERLLGVTLDDVRGRPLHEGLAAWPELARRIGALGHGRTEITRGVGRAARSYELRISPLVSRRQVGGSVCVWRDATEERQVERLREDLTHGLVHDLRGPLTTLTGTLDYFVHQTTERLTSKERELLGVALMSTGRLTTLVEAILDVSRLETGTMPVVRQNLALAPLVEDALALHATQAAAKGLRLVCDVAGTLPHISADPELLRRVLENLIGNSVKFGSSGGTVRVGAAPGADAPYLIVEVDDSGPGLPEEIRAKLFEKFAAGSQSGSGSGLGLAFCRLAIEAHGQRIWAEHRPPGQGTCIRFTLPIVA
jgi:PAS domain S-box-containing protein